MAAQWKDILADSDFQALPVEGKEEIRQKFIAKVESDPDFQTLAPDQQKGLIEKVQYKPVEVQPTEEVDVLSPFGSTPEVQSTRADPFPFEQFAKQETERKAKAKQEFRAGLDVEVKQKAAEGGIINAVEFGFAGSGLGGSIAEDADIYRKQNFQPSGIIEEVAMGAGSLIGDIPTFIAPGSGQLIGFVTSRVLREKNRQQDANEGAALNMEKIAIEAGKGAVERIGYGAVGKLFSFGAAKILPKTQFASTTLSNLQKTGELARGLGRGAIEVSGDTAALVGMGIAMDDAQFTGQTLAADAIFGTFMRTKAWRDRSAGKFSKELSEITSKSIAKREGIPLTDARKMVRNELGMSELYRKTVKNKLEQNIYAENRAKQTKKQAEGVGEISPMEHFINENSLPATKKIERGNYEALTDSNHYTAIDKSIPLTKVEAADIQKNLNTLEPKSDLGNKVNELNRSLFTSWGQAIAKGSTNGAISVKRMYNYISGMEPAVGQNLTRVKDIMGQFDKQLRKKGAEKVLKKVSTTEVVVAEKPGEMLTRLMNNDPSEHRRIWTEEVAKGLNENTATAVLGMVEPMRAVYDDLGKGFQETGGKMIVPVKGEVTFRMRDNFAHRIVDKAKVDADPMRFIEEVNRTNNFGTDKDGNVRKYTEEHLNNMRKLPVETQRNLAREVYADINKDMTAPEAGWQKKRVLEEFPEDFLIKDFNAQVDYMQDVISRTEMNKNFGPDGELLNRDLEAMRGELLEKGFNQTEILVQEKRASDLMEMMLGKHSKGNPFINSVIDGAMSLQVFNKMTTSVFAQPTQMVQAAVRTNAKSFARAMGTVIAPKTIGKFKNREAMHDFIRNSGINLSLSRKIHYDTMFGEGGVLRKFAEGTLRYTGFEKVDAINRTVAGISGMYYADWLGVRVGEKSTAFMKKNNVKTIQQVVDNPILSKQYDAFMTTEARRLAQLNIDIGKVVHDGVWKGDDFVTEMTSLQKKKGAREAEVDSNFRTRALDLPEFRKSNLGKLVTQFKSFDYQQTKNLRDNVYKEAQRGNFEPMKIALTLGVGAGAAALVARTLATKSLVNIAVGEDFDKNTIFQSIEDDDFVRAAADIAAVSLMFPMPVNMALSLKRFGDVGVGASIGSGIRLGTSVRDAFRTGSYKPFAVEAARQFSPAGWVLGRGVNDWLKDEPGIKRSKKGLTKGIGKIRPIR